MDLFYATIHFLLDRKSFSVTEFEMMAAKLRHMGL